MENVVLSSEMAAAFRKAAEAWEALEDGQLDAGLGDALVPRKLMNEMLVAVNDASELGFNWVTGWHPAAEPPPLD